MIIASLVIGFITTIIAIIVLHFGALIVGLVLLFTPFVIAQFVGGSGGNHNNGNAAFFLNMWGSYQAKKNMRRGHRYSK